MKVKELIELLKTKDPERLVILAKDAEGNCYSPLEQDFSTGNYFPQTTWWGEFENDAHTDEDKRHGGEACLVLWPTN